MVFITKLTLQFLLFEGSRQSTPGDLEERINGRGESRRFRGGRDRSGPPPARGRRGGRGSDQDFRRRGRDDDEMYNSEHVDNK